MYCRSCFHLFRIQVYNHFTNFGLKRGLFLENSKHQLAEGLNLLILGRCAKFHCLTLCTYREDSRAPIARTDNKEHTTCTVYIIRDTVECRWHKCLRSKFNQ